MADEVNLKKELLTVAVTKNVVKAMQSTQKKMESKNVYKSNGALTVYCCITIETVATIYELIVLQISLGRLH